jgi:hypothetical protein
MKGGEALTMGTATQLDAVLEHATAMLTTAETINRLRELERSRDVPGGDVAEAKYTTRGQ